MASAEEYADWIVRNADKRGTPDFETVAQAYAMAKNAGKSPSVDLTERPPTTAERIAGNPVTRFAIGAAEPILGAAQAVANLTPAGDAVNEHLATLRGMIDKGRGPNAGWDVAGTAGNVLSPFFGGLAKVLPAGAGALGRAASGAAAGAVGGATTPDYSGGNDYWTNQAVKTGAGAAGGAVLTPMVGKIADAIAPKVSALLAGAQKLGSLATLRTDEAITKALQELKIDASSIPNNYMQEIRQQVLESLKSGKNIDAAALMRKRDFDELGIPSMLGQITRDPTQFARERNLRAVPNVGQPLMDRLQAQNQALQSRIGSYGGDDAQEAVPAGRALIEALASYDKSLKGGVTAAYQAARESAGKDAEIPLAGLANDYATVLDRFGSKVPDGVRNQFKKYGLEGTTQTKLFTVESADDLIKTINDHVGNDAATNNALSQLRNAVKNAVTSDAGVQDVFSPARALAAKRFGLHDAIPALEAAANGAQPDNFVRNFVLKGNTDQVKKLAKVLSENNPEAFNEARRQIGAEIQRAAFGENVAGDKLLTPERMAKALRSIGTEKLQAFYTPEEIATIQRLMRVGAYINQAPSAAPVLGNPNMAWASDLIGKIPGAPTTMRIAAALKNTVNNAQDVNAALAAKVPQTPDISNELARKIAQALTYAGGASGGQTALTFGQ